MEHICECYINNRILPKIRIDISDELAEEILYEKDYLSPYLFLEAYVKFQKLIRHICRFKKIKLKIYRINLIKFKNRIRTFNKKKSLNKHRS